MWLQYWRLSHDPFLDSPGRSIPMATQIDALEQLVRHVEQGERVVWLRGDHGVGKSVVMADALKRLRSAKRRVALVREPAGIESGLLGLIEALEGPRPPRMDEADAWRGLRTQAALTRLQNLSLVLAIDGAQFLPGELWADRLARLDPHPASRLTLIVASPVVDSDLVGASSSMHVRLDGMTRSEMENYIITRLGQAGRHEPIFTPRGLSALHALSEGNARQIHRLGREALKAASAIPVEMIGPELIESLITMTLIGPELGLRPLR